MKVIIEKDHFIRTLKRMTHEIIEDYISWYREEGYTNC